ncbi:MAG: hypothetical protein KJN71_06330, partial [Acidimicrobiia bacterium]|nr:hypothetical protein [Acidimicrobiia bacterium]
MIRSAYLRVYVPATRAGEWRDHVPRNIVRSSDRFLFVESVDDDAFHAEWEGRAYICPREARLRMLEGVLDFGDAHPSAAELLVPARERRRAASQLDSIKRYRPTARSHIVTSPWHVPLRWFSAFAGDERDVVKTASGTSVRYRTDIVSARVRVTRAVEIIEGAGFNEGVIEPIRELAAWLEEFADDSLLELDYGSVAELFDDASLVLDESAIEIGQSIDALAVGDFERAGAFYATV